MTYMLISLLIVVYGTSLIFIARNLKMFELGSFLFVVGYMGLLMSMIYIVGNL